MKLKVEYFYSYTDIKKPNIKEIIEMNKNYEKSYNDNDKLDIDNILDIYNMRLKEYEYGGKYVEIFYIITDTDNIESLKYLKQKTENDKDFIRWIDSEDYNTINSIFISTGMLDEKLKKIINYGKNSNF